VGLQQHPRTLLDQKAAYSEMENMMRNLSRQTDERKLVRERNDKRTTNMKRKGGTGQ
jgi:hypothetical protein